MSGVMEMDSGDIIDSNKFNNIKITLSNDSTKDVGDAFGYGKNSVSPYPTALQTAPTEKYASHYNMSHAKRGLAIIFNHEFFNVSNSLKPRTGTNVDCQNLIDTLKLLSFDVFDYHNLYHRDIVKHLESVANMDHTQHDCLLVAVLSHGELGLLYAHDTPYKAETIWSFFTSDKCPTLSGKPKLFFIQACQGDKLDGGTAVKERTETDGQPTATFRIPTHADFLIAYSTIPGFYSWRNTTRGSWFMQALCIELRENGTRYDILTLLTFVAQRVALDFESNTPDNMTMHQQKQIPCITSMLTRLLKFTPKTSDSNATGSS